MSVICPKCGGQAQEKITRFGVRHDCCGLHSWNGKPLVDQDTHDARQAAHEAFDALWKSKLVSRTEAYALLAAELGLSGRDCHMEKMHLGQALRVVPAVARIRKKLERA